jgi:hypothetical protein
MEAIPLLVQNVESLRTQIRRLFAGDARLSGDPWTLFRTMQDEVPVFRDRHQILVMRYEDIESAMRDPALFSSRTMDGSHIQKALVEATRSERPLLDDLIYLRKQQMVINDEPDHRRLRDSAHRAFTARRVADMTARIKELSDGLLDGLEREETLDWMPLARALPMSVIVEMFGFPARDHEFIRSWGDLWARFWGTERSNLELTHQRTTSFNDYVRGQLELRRRKPGTDLMAALIEAQEETGQLSEDELLVMVANTIFAGHETTINLLGNGLLCLVRDPAAQQRLRADPALMPSAVEEFLRFECPVLNTRRRAVDDIELHGVQIRAGETLQFMVAAGNRDPRRFEDPDELDLSRQNNRHLAFGAGIHYCLGAALARLEAAQLFGAVIERTTWISPAWTDLRWQPNSLFRGLSELPVRFAWR